MPKSNSRLSKPTSAKSREFHESLVLAIPTTAGTTTMSLRSPLLGFGLWVLVMAVIGVGFGLALRPWLGATTIAVRPGLVATVTDPLLNRVITGSILATKVAVVPNLATIETGAAVSAAKIAVSSPIITGTNLQTTLAGDNLHLADDINALQPIFGAYGTQGSVGISASR